MRTERAAPAKSPRKSTGDDAKRATRQVTVLHLSDLHFGKDHRFQLENAPAGGKPKSAGYPTMAEKLVADFEGLSPAPVLVCVTGDLTTQATHEEFVEAERFLRALAGTRINGRPLTMESIFVVPGNHDVAYTKGSVEERLQPWISFYNRLYDLKKPVVAHGDGPYELVRLHDRTAAAGAYVLTINSAMYVQHNTAEQDRGNIDHNMLERIEKLLKSVPRKKLNDAIKIAILHHHPILIPPLAEADRSYDAVVNSGVLLQLLRRHGFHVILHGHKHHPHTFTDDTRSAFGEAMGTPLFVAAGGSVGSRELPGIPSAGNTYNRLSIKYHAAARQWRVHVETRRLKLFAKGRRELLPHRWSWETIDEDDRSFFADARLPRPCVSPVESSASDARAKEYERRRGNMPVVEVFPSMIPGQAYEARVWLVAHKRQPKDEPTVVEWSAGERFPMFRIERAEDPLFCAAFHFWGPMLVQAVMTFADGERVTVFIYAHLPETYPAP